MNIKDILGKRNVKHKVVSSLKTKDQDLINNFMHAGDGERPWESLELTQGQDVREWIREPEKIEGIQPNLKQLSNRILNINQNWPCDSIKILDVGCYAGYLYDYLVKNHNINYTGIDINQDVIESAKILHKNTTAKFKVGDIFDPPPELLDNMFDVVCCHRLTIHLPYFEQALFNLINLSKDIVHVILFVGEDCCDKCMETNVETGKTSFYYKRYVSAETINSILNKGIYSINHIIETCNDSMYSSLFIFK